MGLLHTSSTISARFGSGRTVSAPRLVPAIGAEMSGILICVKN